MKKIYIILTQSGTIVSKAIKFFTHDEFNHSSIALDNTLKKFYSFGRIYRDIVLPGGFVIENAFTHVFGKFKKIPCMILEKEVSDEQYEVIKNEINEFIINRKKYSYDLKNLFFAKTKITFKHNNKYFCSSFVAHILDVAKIPLPHSIEKMRPYEFSKLDDIKVYYKGELKEIASKAEKKDLEFQTA